MLSCHREGGRERREGGRGGRERGREGVRRNERRKVNSRKGKKIKKGHHKTMYKMSSYS